jgi:hypothetical protein
VNKTNFLLTKLQKGAKSIHRNCLTFASTWIHIRYLLGIRIIHHISFLCLACCFVCLRLVSR